MWEYFMCISGGVALGIVCDFNGWGLRMVREIFSTGLGGRGGR